MIDEAGIPHQNVVFEVIESDAIEDIKHLDGVLKFYRRSGFRVALDDIGAGYSSLNLIHQLHPDFIKLDMALVRGVHEDHYKAEIAKKILEIAQNLKISTVGEGIESREELRWMLGHGANYVQGYLVAKPASPPVTVTARIGD